MISVAIFLAVWLGFGFVSNLLDEIYSRFGDCKTNMMFHLLFGPVFFLLMIIMVGNEIHARWNEIRPPKTRTPLTTKIADRIMIRFEPQKGLKK